ncbi:unnamed protein product [Auanema sp. JU1783]|nr:unnamed protein product [Auanema sp. JU1783]
MLRHYVFLPIFLLSFRYVFAVINGIPTTSAKVKSQAVLLIGSAGLEKNRKIICGGALITTNVVLTAAHCVYSNSSFATSIQVRLNTFNIRRYEPAEIRLLSRAIEIFPNYREDEDASEDLAIVYLPRPITEACSLKDGPEIARLPPSPYTVPLHANPMLSYLMTPLSDFEMETGFCFVHGWGLNGNSQTDEPSTALLRLSIRTLYGKKVLVGEPLSPLTKLCMGDSGSPVYCLVRGQNFLVGIVSELSTWMPDTKADVDQTTDERARCMMYDFVVIVDLRHKVSGIQTIFNQRGLTQQLKHGQQQCSYL